MKAKFTVNKKCPIFCFIHLGSEARNIISFAQFRLLCMTKNNMIPFRIKKVVAGSSKCFCSITINNLDILKRGSFDSNHIYISLNGLRSSWLIVDCKHYWFFVYFILISGSTINLINANDRQLCSPTIYLFCGMF